MPGTDGTRLKRLTALHRRYTGPIPKRALAQWEAGGDSANRLRNAAADLRFWREYLKVRLSACRRASGPSRRARIVEDIRIVWPIYRRAAKQQEDARRTDAVHNKDRRLYREGRATKDAR